MCLLLSSVIVCRQVYQETFQKDIYHALSWALRRNVAFFAELICQQVRTAQAGISKHALLSK